MDTQDSVRRATGPRTGYQIEDDIRSKPQSRSANAPGSGSLQHPAKKWLSKLPPLLCIGVFLFHLYTIQKYAINLPLWDDWGMFLGDNHPASVDLPWLYAQVNDHRTATTKLFVWAQFQLNGWNIRVHSILAFLIYGSYLLLLVSFARKLAPNLPAWTVCGFILFFLSPVIWIDHEVAYAVAVHLWLLFMVIGARCLFSETQAWRILVLGCLSSILSIYTFAAGVATSLVILTGFGLFKGIRVYSAKNGQARVRETLQLLLVVGLIGSSLAVWIAGYVRPHDRLPWILPYDWRFWTFLLNVISFGFAIERISVFWGGVCSVIVIAPICWVIVKQRGRLSNAQWASFVVTLAILADLCMISIGRASYGVETTKYLEYAEHGMPLIVLSVINWGVLLVDRGKMRTYFFSALWLFCFMTFLGNWNFSVYRSGFADKMEGLRCVKDYYANPSPAQCLTVFPFSGPFTPYLDQAKRLNASFYRELSKPSESTPDK